MLNLRIGMLLAAALMLALGAVYLAHDWMESQKKALQANSTVIRTFPVVAAASQINPYEKIKPEQLKILRIPEVTQPPDTSLPGGGLNVFAKIEDVAGKFVVQTLYPNEMIVRQRLRDSVGPGTLSNMLAPGMRAVTVRVNEATGVAGFLVSGNHVDILVTRKASGGRAAATSPVLQNVKILAVDQNASVDDKGKPAIAKTVTVEIRPQDAANLLRAMDMGTIQMVLRNPGDELMVPESAYAAQDKETPATLPEAHPAAPGPVPVHATMPPARRSPPPAAVVAAPPPPPRKPGRIRSLVKGGKIETLECFDSGCIPQTPETIGQAQSDRTRSIPQHSAPSREAGMDLNGGHGDIGGVVDNRMRAISDDEEAEEP